MPRFPWIALLVGMALADARMAHAQGGAHVDALGDPLPAGTQFRLGTTRLQLDREIQAVAVSADGKRLAAVSDTMLGVWELPGGKETLRLHHDPFDQAPAQPLLALSGDGQTLITNSSKLARLLEARSGKLRAQLSEQAADAVFAADGKTVTLAQLDMRIVRHDVTTGDRLHDWRFHAEPTLHEQNAGGYAVQFRLSRDGRLLVALESNRTGRRQQVRIHEAASGNEVARWPVELPAPRRLDVSADGRFIVAAGAESGKRAEATARVWEMATGKELARWQLRGGLSSGRPALAFAPDDATVLATDAAGVGRWDWRTGKRLQEYPDVGGPLAFTDGGKTLVAQGPLGAVRLLDLATGKERCPLPHAGPQVAIAPDGRSVAWSDGGVIVLTDTATGRELRRWPAHERFVGPLAFAPDGKTLASAGTDLRIRLWKIPEGREQRTLIRTGVNRLWFTPDGRHLVSSGPGDLCLWDRATGKRLGYWYGRGDAPVLAPDLSAIAIPDRNGQRLRLEEPIARKELHTFTGYRGRAYHATDWPAPVDSVSEGPAPPQFSPDGRLLLLAVDSAKPSEYSEVQVVDLATLRPSAVLRGQDTLLSALAFAPDSRQLAAMRADHRPCLLHAHSGALARLFAPCEGMLSAAPVFTGDGRMLVTTALSHRPLRPSIQVWEVATGDELARWTGHPDDIHELSVSANGRLLVSMSADHTALGWDLAHLADAERSADPWADLASPDAKRGRRAIETLRADSKQALALLKRQLQPVPGADGKQVARWLAELDSDDFAQRTAAEQALERTAETAGPLLTKALTGQLPLETRRRAQGLLRKLHGPTLSAEQVRAVRAVQVLEELRSPEARRLLDALARGAPAALLTREAQAALGRCR